MGLVTGLTIAFIFYQIHKWLPTTPSIDIVLSFVVSFLMYITAEKLHFSRVLSLVGGGLFLSRRRHLIYRQIIDKQRRMPLHMNKKADFEEDIIRKHFTQLDLEQENLTKLAE